MIELPFQGALRIGLPINPGRCHWAELSWAFSPQINKPEYQNNQRQNLIK